MLADLLTTENVPVKHLRVAYSCCGSVYGIQRPEYSSGEQLRSMVNDH